jgi:hypothetical protein
MEKILFSIQGMSIGVDLIIKTKDELDIKLSDSLHAELHKLYNDIVYEQNKQTIEERHKDYKYYILNCFPDNIFVEEIPNEYSPNDPYYRGYKWLIITTKIGRFKIGSRKRVFHVEWTDTLCNKTSEELFPNETVTKYDKVIHAWNFQKMKEYVDTIMKEFA